MASREVHLPSRRAVAALSLMLAFGAAGCAEPLELPIGSCPALAQHLVQCEGAAASPAAIERRCRQYPVDFEAHVTCSALLDCGRFEACVTAARAAVDPARRARRLIHYLESLRDALATDDFESAEAVCTQLAADPDRDAEVLARCQRLSARAVEVYVKRLKALRDAPRSAEAGLVECKRAEHFATTAGDEALSTIRRVCAEATLAVEVAAVQAATVQAAAVQAGTVQTGTVQTGTVRTAAGTEPEAGTPMGCEHAIALARVDATPYAQTALGTLLDLCALAPARRLLGADKGSCDHRFVRLRSWLGSTELDLLEDIAALRKFARERCGR